MLYKNSLGLIAICCILFCCGKKKKEEEPAPIVTETPDGNGGSIKPVAKGLATIHLHTFVSEDELVGYEDNVFLGERRISMSLGLVFLSGLELVNMDGTIFKMSDTVILKNQDNMSYEISNVPVGKYKSLRFKIGLDSASRLKSPLSSLGGVLNNPEMWFESSPKPQSYVFAHFKGMMDTAAVPKSSNVRVPYEFKIGTDSNYVQVQLPVRIPGTEFNITEKTKEVFHMYMDLDILLKDVNFHDTNGLSVLTKEDNNSASARKLAKNIAKMFRYE